MTSQYFSLPPVLRPPAPRQPAALLAERLAALLPALLTIFLSAFLSACTPALDWREHRFDEGGFTILFPQKPGRSERKLATPAGEVTMKMVSVRVDETVFGAASADFASTPDAPTQEAMRNALLKNFDGTIISDQAVSVGFSLMLITPELAGPANLVDYVRPKIAKVAVDIPAGESAETSSTWSSCSSSPCPKPTARRARA